jgi:hypothetical protein
MVMDMPEWLDVKASDPDAYDWGLDSSDEPDGGGSPSGE